MVTPAPTPTPVLTLNLTPSPIRLRKNLLDSGCCFGTSLACARGVRSRLFWTPAPVLTNQTPDPAPGQ